jgi:hypothetical protein
MLDCILAEKSEKISAINQLHGDPIITNEGFGLFD